MTWELVPFQSMGPVQFGMSISEVTSLLGPPLKTRVHNRTVRETRSPDMPAIYYVNDGVSEIEAFRQVPGLTWDGVPLLQGTGLAIMKKLEHLNGGAQACAGVVLFRKLGITTGRLDTCMPEEHSIRAFHAGLRDANPDAFDLITFHPSDMG